MIGNVELLHSRKLNLDDADPNLGWDLDVELAGNVDGLKLKSRPKLTLESNLKTERKVVN